MSIIIIIAILLAIIVSYLLLGREVTLGILLLVGVGYLLFWIILLLITALFSLIGFLSSDGVRSSVSGFIQMILFILAIAVILAVIGKINNFLTNKIKNRIEKSKYFSYKNIGKIIFWGGSIILITGMTISESFKFLGLFETLGIILVIHIYISWILYNSYKK
jgi:hypothetical protein